MELSLIKTATDDKVKLPYTVVVSFAGEGRGLRKDLVSRYSQGDFSCHVERYISTATIHFRNEIDAADFLMRI